MQGIRSGSLQLEAQIDPLIRKLNHFSKLSSQDRETLAVAAGQRVRRFDARQDISIEGEKPEVMNLIQDGWACRYKVLEDGRRQIVSFFLPGDLCDLNVFVLQELDHSIGTITPVTLSEISKQMFEELMGASPRIAQALWWESLVSAAIQREWTVNVGRRDAFERVAHLLCELFIRLRSVGMSEGDSCDFPLTQSDLGEATGLSNVHVNRVLQELRSANLIVLKQRKLTIPDLAALQHAALFNENYLHLGGEGSHLDANER